MKVMYTGPTPLAYHSSPSRTDYVFDPGVDHEIKDEDMQFFKDMIAAPGSCFKLGGWKTKIEPNVKATIEPLVNVAKSKVKSKKSTKLEVYPPGKDNYAKNKKKINGGKN